MNIIKSDRKGAYYFRFLFFKTAQQRFIPTMSHSEEKDKGDQVSSSTRTAAERTEQNSCVSLRSDASMEPPIVFKKEDSDSETEQHSCVSLRSDASMELPIVFQDSVSRVPQETPEASTGCKTQLGFIFTHLTEKIDRFVRTELKRIEAALNGVHPQGFEVLDEDEQEIDAEEAKPSRSRRAAFLEITQQFLREMNQGELADCLQKKTVAARSHRDLKLKFRTKFQCVSEGIAKQGAPTLLNQIYTDLYITEGGTGEVNSEHEVRQIEYASRKSGRPETTIRCQDIFKPSPGREEPFRRVITKGVAGIGKTVLTQKFTLDWAWGKTNRDTHFILPFTFKELNVLKEKHFSLLDLVHHFFPETKEICRFEEFKVLLILDGLDECRFPLDFNKETLTHVTEVTSVDVLLTNLIRGNLLPSAQLWITTRPAAANQIPAGCVDLVTEVRGFTDPQKEEYFRRRFRDKEQASRNISHIKTCQSLHIMCHIPVFCWITATVLEDLLHTREGAELPRTLTEMYIHFLVVQSKLKNIKYDGGAETDPHWSPGTRKMIESLGKLAFEQLQKGNLIFYESDLRESGVDITAASVYSGVFTQFFQEERGLYRDKVFCFIHLSVQEFLAALYVHLTFINSGVNLLSDAPSNFLWSKLFGSDPAELYLCAVDKSLQSPNGHLDLFLRFLLGLSLETNQSLLQGLLRQTGSRSQTLQHTTEYIKKEISENLCPEKAINLFHCLNELKDGSLVEEIQRYLSSGCLSTDKLSPGQWSALVFVLLSSSEHLDEFDLQKYSATEENLLRLMPVVKASSKALLSCCNLSETSVEALSSALSCATSSLRELDLSNNDLHDSGVMKLCAGLGSPRCKLETLRLSGCLITKKGCAALASALRANPSHLRELDLSYNHPGDASRHLLPAGPQGPEWRVEIVRMEPGGSQWMKSGLRKYACGLTLDPDTANRKLILSDHNTKVTLGRAKQEYPDLPDRFDYWKQLLCTDGMKGRCYWEVEWTGQVYVAVTYRGIRRRGEGDDSCLGRNDQSWSLGCSGEAYSIRHNTVKRFLAKPSSRRVGVYLDWAAGTLSFYSVSSDRWSHIHTFRSTFTEPLYAAFRIRTDPFDSSLSLPHI